MGPIRKMICALMCAIPLMMLGMCCDTFAQEKMQGWAKVPGGTVWLEPGRQAYEHDTGLVRDLVTGQKSRPITPQSFAQPNCCPPQPFVSPYPLQPYVGPQPLIPVQPLIVPPAYPVPPTYSPNPYRAPVWFDVGPGNVYLPSLYSNRGSGYGVKLGATQSINSKWKQTRLPTR